MATSREIKDGYTSTLQDLTCNSKPLISVLTMLAEENVAHAKDIVEAIEVHLSKVRTEVKLPVLYLIDCIIKNVGGPYTSAFCNNIVPLFCSVFLVVDEKTRTEMYKLRQTWNDVLPKSKLYALDVQTSQMDPAWPITAPPPNIHFNPKFLKTSTTMNNKKEQLSTKPSMAALVPSGVSQDPATLDMQQRLIIKQKELLELQQKKLELELLQTQVKLQEQLKKTQNNSDDVAKMSAKNKNLLLKPEVAKQLLQESGELGKAKIGMGQRSTNVGMNLPKIAPVNSALLAAAKTIRDPRLLRQQVAQQNTVNSNVQLENKSNTTNTLDNKLVNIKMSGRNDRADGRFVNNKEDPPKSKTANLSRIPLKSKRSSSPNSNKSSSKTGSGRISLNKSPSSGSGSTSSLDSPTKSSKSSRSTSKSPSKYKKGGNSSSLARADKKPGKSSKTDRKSPTKDSTFKDVKGLTKNRNYIRRNRDVSLSPEGDRQDVDLRVGGPPEKLQRIQGDNVDDKSGEVDLRNVPAVIGKKRPSVESSLDLQPAKKSKSEMFDVLFGNEDVDLRQMPIISSSPSQSERPPTPPPPIISNKSPTKPKANEKENSVNSSNGSPARDIQNKANFDALRAKLANATNKDKIKQSRFSNIAVEPKKNVLEETLSKIIISPSEEEIIKAGNMTKAQESALMNKIIAQIENQKLKEAKRKDTEENVGNISLQPISDDELDSDNNDSVEIVEIKNDVSDRLHSDDHHNKPTNFESRFRRGYGPMWRGNKRGFPGPRGPIRPPRQGVEPWIRGPHPSWRPPFNKNNFDEDNKVITINPDILDTRSNSPIITNEPPDIVVSSSNQDDTKSINIDGEPRDILFYDETAVAFMNWEDPREISFQAGSRRVTFDDKESYTLSFNEPYRDCLINGSTHKVRLGAPTREIYIDGKSYECFFGGPSIGIEINGKLTVVKIEGPPPQVKIGLVRRTDLVAGKINLIIDAKQIVPVYLDARIQKFEIEGKMHTLKFTDALQTVLINDIPFKVEFGGLPKPISVNDRKHFVRFSVLPRGIKPGRIRIKDMPRDSSGQSDNENSQDGFENSAETPAPAPPVITKKKSRFSDDSPERNTLSPGSIQNMLAPNFGNLDSLLSNALTATQTPTSQTTGGYQIENNGTENNQDRNPESKPFPVLFPPALQPTLNINDLFQKLVATGIVTSNLPSSLPEMKPEPMKPTKAPVFEKPEPMPLAPELPIIKPKKPEFLLKYVDFNKHSSLKVRQPALIQALYSGMQCSSCGMRFPPENSMLYSQHLDWHFRQNRKGKKNIRKATSRRWYYNISDWNNYEEIEDLEEREKCYFENQQTEQKEGGTEEADEEIEIPSVPADSSIPNQHCEVCQEKFEQFYNEEKEEWHLRMAIRIEDRTYHPLCYEDYQASLVYTTLEDSGNQSSVIEKEDNSIPGLEVPLDEEKENESETPEIIIDDVESIESVANTPKPDEENKEDKDDEDSLQYDDDDDDVIINEVLPERIILDEYEFKGTVDGNDVLADVIVKQEPIDDGFTDIENFKIGEVKIKTEPSTPDETFEDIGQVIPESELPKEIIQVASDTTHTELVPTMDGNVECNSGAQPSSGISGKIKINISKQLPVIAPKENKDISLDVDNTIEPIDPTQPLPPGEEPVQLNLKPALQGIELKKLPPVNKGSELTGLCSIM